jgi:site-specific recombinase
MEQTEIVELTNILERLSRENAANVRLLSELVHWLRQGGESGAALRLRFLTSELKKRTWHSHALSDLVTRISSNYSYIRLFTESGMTNEDSFFDQVKTRLFNKILPVVHDENNAANFISLLFSKKNDWEWIAAIPDEDWREFLTELKVKEVFRLPRKHPHVAQLLNSIQNLSLKIAALGVKREILDKLPELDVFDSPFIIQHSKARVYLHKFQSAEFDQSINNEDFQNIEKLLAQCEGYIQKIQDNKSTWGVTLKLTNFLIRLKEHIIRIRLLYHLITTHEAEPPLETEIHFLKEIVRAENKNNSIGEIIRENLQLIAYQVTEHAGQSGEAYITTTKKEYLSMYLKALGGGAIVSLLVLFKVEIASWNLPLFLEALAFSLLYGSGFVFIQIASFKLATKQPAMIASHLARILDEEKIPTEAVKRLAPLIVQISRSQFVAFLGNLSAAIPLGLFHAWLWKYSFGDYYINEEKALKMYQDVHPWQSLSLFFAIIAGFWLYLSGLVSGYFDNFCIYNKIPLRIQRLEVLRRFIPAKKILRLSRYVEENLGSLAGNFYFGFFLGFTFAIGVVLGLPLDIRHITFAAAGTGVATITLWDQLEAQSILIALLGVVGIGIMNFSMSFGLSIVTAIRSRRLHFGHWKELALEVLKLFLNNPVAFFVPGGGGRFLFKKNPASNQDNH